MDELERALKPIKDQLKDQKDKLNDINDTLKTVAVQSSRLNEQDRKIEDLYSKWNTLLDPERGVIHKIQDHQASCPRGQVKALWSIIIPLSMLILSVTALVVKNI